MTEYGQFCSVARAHELLGGRWTLLIVREILCGGRRFNDIRRGIPRVSRTVLSERLQALVLAGAISRTDGAHGPEYAITEAGQELVTVVSALGTWGQRWLARDPANEDIDLAPLLVDMQRRVNFTALPKEPFVVRFEVRGHQRYFMLLKQTEASLCRHNPGFPEPVCVQGPLAALAAWWRGDTNFVAAQRMGLTIDGPRAFTRASEMVRPLHVRSRRVGEAGASASHRRGLRHSPTSAGEPDDADQLVAPRCARGRRSSHSIHWVCEVLAHRRVVGQRHRERRASRR